MSPPMAAAGPHTFHRRRTTNAAVADTGMARNIRKFARPIGPTNGANGAVRSPSSGAAVFCPRLTPVGLKSEWLKKGSKPWPSA